MKTVYLQATDATALQITRASFPSYSGKKFQVKIVDSDYQFSLVSGWSGGSRDTFVVVSLSDMKAVNISGIVGDHFSRQAQTLKLVDGIALVEHSMFCGKDMGITIWLLESNAAKLLPPAIELSPIERVVLIATAHLKSFARKENSGLDLATWNDTVTALKARKFLMSNGAITPDGRNAIGERMSLDTAKELAGIKSKYSF